MQYIPKYIINHYFPEVAEFLKNDKSETPEDYFHSPSRNIEVERKIIDPKEASLFFKQLTPENWIYINWISELPELEKFLLGSLPEISFSDNLKWQEHALFNSFQSFISPFLEKIILANNTSTLAEKAIMASYFCLLDQGSRNLVELTIAGKFLEERKQIMQQFIEDSHAGNFDATLVQLCNDEAITLFYHIGNANYALKIEYSELLLELVKHPLCERKTLLWIIRMLEKMGLRNEHLLQLKSIHTSTVNNALKHSLKNYKKPISAKLILVVLLLIVPVSIWFFTQLNQQYSSENELLERKTSFEQFNPDERKKIDSLLHQIEEKNRDANEVVTDFSDTRVNIIAGLKNKKMASIYKDLWLDLESVSSLTKDSCTKFLNDHRVFYENTKPLDKRDASASLYIENGSTYDVLICVFKEEKSADVFSLLLKKGKSTTFNLEVDEHLLFLPGKQFSKLSHYEASGPSKAFLAHFCDKDNNYSSMLNEFYTFERTKKTGNKLYLSGDKNSFFNIMDLGSVLRLL
ncbi:MAG: hypothetical protein ACK50Y_03820 [Flavobacteriia bacterium]|jgi:hypothetical protein